jgi:putative DNA primase/helicase
VTLLVGDPGRGKSLLALDMAARVTTGAPWPDQEPQDGDQYPADVVLLTAEDDTADTVRPRLEAAGGDPARVVVVRALRRPGAEGDQMFSLAHDIKVLEACIGQCDDARLVVMDPVSAYLEGADAHSNEGLRTVLAPLRSLAERTGVAALAINHLTKKSDTAVMYRAMGSMAFVAAARAVWAVGPDRQTAGRLLFLPVKCNLAGGLTGLAYRIVPSAQSPDVPVLAWEPGAIALSAEEALDARINALTRREQAGMWLESVLANGPVPAAELEKQALATGLSLMTLRRAKRELKVETFRIGFAAGCLWSLPGDAHESLAETTSQGEGADLCPSAPPTV